MASTVLDIITDTMLLLNVNAIGDSMSAEEATYAKRRLGLLLERWSNQGMAAYYLSNETYSMTANVQTYTIGPSGATFTAQRPVSIESAFTRLNNGTNNVDYPMRLIDNATYQAIPVKDITAMFPTHLLYTPTYPNATITIFPKPSQALTLGITQRHQFTAYTALADDIALPIGYASALIANLAKDMAAQYGKEEMFARGSLLDRQAEESLAELKRVNYRPIMLATDPMMVGSGRYSIYSDSFNNRR